MGKPKEVGFLFNFLLEFRLYDADVSRGFYRSILFETLKQRPGLPQDVFPAFADHTTLSYLDQSTPFRISGLKTAFKNLTRVERFRTYRFCFFVDGLDEYKGDSV